MNPILEEAKKFEKSNSHQIHRLDGTIKFH